MIYHKPLWLLSQIHRQIRNMAVLSRSDWIFANIYECILQFMRALVHCGSLNIYIYALQLSKVSAVQTAFLSASDSYFFQFHSMTQNWDTWHLRDWSLGIFRLFKCCLNAPKPHSRSFISYITWGQPGGVSILTCHASVSASGTIYRPCLILHRRSGANVSPGAGTWNQDSLTVALLSHVHSSDAYTNHLNARPVRNHVNRGVFCTCSAQVGIITIQNNS